MHLVRAEHGVSYQPPGHHGVEAVRLQGPHVLAGTGADGPGPVGVQVGVSRYPPGSRVDRAPTAAATVYVVLSGRLELTAPDGEVVDLGPHDSVYLPLGEPRALRNTSAGDATLLVVLADLDPARPAQEAP